MRVFRSGEHCWQSALLDLPASFKYVSTSHSLHVVSPLESWYWPGAHALHVPFRCPYLPNPHPWQVAAPSFHVVSPMLHCWHCVGSRSLALRAYPTGHTWQPSPNVPAPHCWHLALPGSDVAPTPQDSQWVELASSLCMFSGHCWHVVCPVWF